MREWSRRKWQISRRAGRYKAGKRCKKKTERKSASRTRFYNEQYGNMHSEKLLTQGRTDIGGTKRTKRGEVILLDGRKCGKA